MRTTKLTDNITQLTRLGAVNAYLVREEPRRPGRRSGESSSLTATATTPARSTGCARSSPAGASRASDAVHAIRATLHGFVALEAGGGFGLPEDVDESFERLVAMLVSGLAAAGSDAHAVSTSATG
jgi:hypothetical protein